MEQSYRFVGQEKYTIIGPWQEPKIIESQPPAYWNSSVLKPRNFYETGLEESLEKIVLLDETTEEEAPIGEKMFADKSKTLKATIKALFNEILTREMLNDVLLKKIDSDARRTETYLHEVRALTIRDYSRQFADMDKRRTQIDGRLLDLEKERRQEYLTCWKDLGQLKKYVLSSLKDYWNLKGGRDFLGKTNDRHRSTLQEIETYPR